MTDRARSLSLLALCLPLLTHPALAQMDTANNRLIPYQGMLEESGAVQNGDFDFRFALFADAGAATDCLVLAAPGTCGVWWDQVDGVPVQAGAFAVTLGHNGARPLTDAVFAQTNLYLAIAVKQSGETAFTLLAGKQRLLAVPFANRAAAAKNYTVNGDLTVSGDILRTAADGQIAVSQNFALRDTGDTTLRLRTGAGSTTYANFAAGTLTATNGLAVSGGNINVSAGNLSVSGTASAGSVTSTGAVSAGSVSSTGAVSAGSVSSTGAVSGASVSATGAVSGASLSVSGNISADSNSRSNCYWTAEFSEEDSAMTCSGERYVAGVNCWGSYCDRLQLYCCDL